MNILKKYFPYLLILILGLFAFLPILSKGFFPIHDNTQVARIYEMSKGLSDGMFPVRWSKDLGFGYGYPIFNFYAPLAYYIGGFLNILGIDVLSATKLTFILGTILAGFSMYLFSREFFGKQAAVLSALLYLYAPYHALDIYVRGDLAELFAYGLLPFVFYFLYKLYKEISFKWLVLSSISYSLLIISHNLTAFMATPFLIVFCIFLIYKNPKSIIFIILSFLFGIALSAFYSFPALLEMNYTNVISQVGGGADFKDHFVCLSQLWSSPWGYGGSAKGCVDGLSFMVGKIQILFAFFSLIAVVVGYIKHKFSSKEKTTISFIILFLIFVIFSVFLMTEFSIKIWQALKPMEFIQYPWRYLIITEFCLSLIAGGLLWTASKFLSEKQTIILSVGFAISIIVLCFKFFVPQTILNVTESNFVGGNSIKWNASTISSEFMPISFKKPKSENELPNLSNIENENIKIVSFNQKTQQLILMLNLTKNEFITLPIAYFPAWRAYVNDKITEITPQGKGIGINLGKGDSLIKVKFEQTILEKLSNAISIAGAICLVAGIIYYRKKYE